MPDVPLVVSPSPTTRSQRARDGRDRIAADLARLIEGEVRFGRHDRMLYATDASIYQVEPIGVVIPRSSTDVERIVGYAAQHGLPLLPRGAGSSLAGQSVNDAIVIDFSVWLRRVLQIDATRRTARVEPGVVLDDLNAALAGRGLMFAPDVATSTHACIGGMIGNNSAGVHSIVYGRTVEHVAAIEVLMADGTRLRLAEGAASRDERVADLTRRVADVVRPLAGEIRERFPRTLRRVNGYNLDLVLDQLERSAPGTFDRVNLAHLFCGAEGTLGVVVEAEVQLVEPPRHKGLSIIAFTSLEAALGALGAILATGPAAVELIDDVVIAVARENTEYRRYVELLPSAGGGPPGAVLYVEYFADELGKLERLLDDLDARLSPLTVRRYTDPTAMGRAWKLRKAGEPLLCSLPGARKPLTFIEDAAVDPSKLADFVRAFGRIVEAHGTKAAYYAHASVGCLHIRPMIDLRDPADARAMESIAAEVTDLVREFGGALSGEHGDGRARSHLLERFYGPAICDGFRAVKAIFDPENRMNPGNIVEAPPMGEKLRAKPADRTIAVDPVRTFFRYRREEGLMGAVEMCNGAGVCRKMSGGTMCPSYRATRDERHATRGRGNALRLAITGQLSPDGRTPAWDDPETIRTLDLCLSCKACKSECPSNVDIAKLKAEYTAQRFARRPSRIPISSRVFARVRAVNRIGSALRPVANAGLGFPPARFLLDRALGLDHRRTIPRFERSLYRWLARRPPPALDATAPVVVLLGDCFTVYTEPRIARAAVVALEAFGYRVVVPRIGCCGRAMISTGMLAAAAPTCRATAEALLRSVDAHRAVALLGCEPSCVSAVQDDWLDLEMGVDPGRLEGLAAVTSLVEEFLEARWSDHPRRPELRVDPGSRPALLHLHCHQKALGGGEATRGLLTRLLGDRLRVIDSGCCGMAGSFGMTRDHYDLSMRIGELSVFGPIRAEPEATVIAPGTSCRHQIHDGTGRVAVHPMELVAEAITI